MKALWVLIPRWKKLKLYDVKLLTLAYLSRQIQLSIYLLSKIRLLKQLSAALQLFSHSCSYHTYKQQVEQQHYIDKFRFELSEKATTAFKVSKSDLHNSRTKHYFANPQIKIQLNVTKPIETLTCTSLIIGPTVRQDGRSGCKPIRLQHFSRGLVTLHQHLCKTAIHYAVVQPCGQVG